MKGFRRPMRVNVAGMYLAAKHALPFLFASRPGIMVNRGSAAGLAGMKRRFASCATKEAVVAMIRQLAIEYRPG